MAFIQGLDLGPTADLSDETSLLRSGLFDSTALFHLVDWIERQIGAPVDPTAVDLVREWDTVPGILSFIARQRDSGAFGADEDDRD